MKPIGRFAVVASDGRRSSEWRIWTGRKNPSDDVYIAPRSLAGDFKVSLHKDGYAQHGPTETVRRTLRVGDRGAIARWRTVPADTAGIKIVYLIRFFTAELRSYGTPLGPDCWVVEVPPGTAGICLGIAFSAEDDAPRRLESKGWEVIGIVPRRTGIAALIRAPLVLSEELRISILESLGETQPPPWTWRSGDSRGQNDLHGWIYSPDDSLVPVATELSGESLRTHGALSLNIEHDGFEVLAWESLAADLQPPFDACAVLVKVKDQPPTIYLDLRARCDFQALILEARALVAKLESDGPDSGWDCVDGGHATAFVCRPVHPIAAAD